MPRTQGACLRPSIKARDEAAALVPLLPAQVVRAMMGGDLGIQQVPCPERRERMLVAMLLERAGTEDRAQTGAGSWGHIALPGTKE